eukprot:TRINITY_DN2199_c0_g2_i3.p1 TRINITY_DN2199_c0_g2~~TRINITY_DN2199_c0_g2_i3.p1  ORF type:complete len:613 (-),score=116.89 TRINITY_DN2199_c0_g2_i3:43-1791(-)
MNTCSRAGFLLLLSVASAADDMPNKVLVEDDACEGGEEECSLSLRQLRLRSRKERTEDFEESEVDDFEQVFDFDEADAEGGCFESGTYYLEHGHPHMRGTHRMKVNNAKECQAKCAGHGGCAHFSFWHDGGCLLTGAAASPHEHSGVTAGPPSCSAAKPVNMHVEKPTFTAKQMKDAQVSRRGGLDPPKTVSTYNGVAWETMKVHGRKEMHIFAIGDWGALDGTLPGVQAMVQYGGGNTPGPHTMARWRGPCKTKDMVNCFAGSHCKHSCHWSDAVDGHAQLHVATQMQKRAAAKDPDFFLNVGDNFYWGGVNTFCGMSPMDEIGYTARHQFNNIFESIYTGPGVDGKPWFSVLGNHDYGGFQFNKAWDQQIAYTWASDRWRMPAVYWMQRVEYPDLGFSAEFFMLDSNAMDVKPLHGDPEHNICGAKHNPQGASCAKTGGPKDVRDCFKFMWDLWREQQHWLERKLQHSNADWQVAVTHFNCGHQAEWYKKLHLHHGLDLLVTGHTHVQAIHHKMHQLGGMTCFITGGGGGITSEGDPNHPHSNQYGFFDLTISKHSMTIESINYMGEQVGKVHIQPKGKR